MGGTAYKEPPVKNPLRKAAWSPYAVGAGIGILSWFTFLIMLKPLSTSTAFVRAVAFVIGIFSVDHVAYTPYLSKYAEFRPVFEWQFMLVIGLFIGAWISAKFAGISFGDIPYLWGENFGYKGLTRIIGAMIGGFMLLFGARLAGGCTLGHGISGGLQLVTLSWLFVMVVFGSGIVAANILYRKK